MAVSITQHGPSWFWEGYHVITTPKKTYVNIKYDETLPNFIKKMKAPKKGREKEARGKDQSSGKQRAQQKRQATRR